MGFINHLESKLRMSETKNPPGYIPLTMHSMMNGNSQHSQQRGRGENGGRNRNSGGGDRRRNGGPHRHGRNHHSARGGRRDEGRDERPPRRMGPRPNPQETEFPEEFEGEGEEQAGDEEV